MNRRGFLGLLGGAAAGLALDPERALWVPGRRLISVPRPGRYYPEPIVARYVQVLVDDNLALQRVLNGQYSALIDLHRAMGRLPKIGDTIFVRRPARFVPR